MVNEPANNAEVEEMKSNLPIPKRPADWTPESSKLAKLRFEIQQTRASLRRSAIVAMTLGVVALILSILSILSKP